MTPPVRPIKMFRELRLHAVAHRDFENVKRPKEGSRDLDVPGVKAQCLLGVSLACVQIGAEPNERDIGDDVAQLSGVQRFSREMCS